MLPSAQSIIIELGCLDICNRNMRKFVVKYNQMECSCKHTSCFVNKMYYFGLLAFRLIILELKCCWGSGIYTAAVKRGVAPYTVPAAISKLRSAFFTGYKNKILHVLIIMIILYVRFSIEQT